MTAKPKSGLKETTDNVMQMQKQRIRQTQDDSVKPVTLRETRRVSDSAQELLDSEILDEIDEALEGLDEQLGKTYRQAGGE
jgi:hypothetical protein